MSAAVADSSILGLDESYLEPDTNAWQEGGDSDLDHDESFYVPSTSFLKELATVNPASFHGLGNEFSTEENFDQTSAYVNHQLGIHGFPANLQFLNADKTNASKIVTALYSILQQHSKNVKYKEEMDLNWRRLSSDYDITLQNLNTTKEQLEKSQRESAFLGSRVAALEEELRIESEKHRHAREELKSAKANLQYAKTQYTHEARKKEQEVTVLKDKLQKAVDRTASTSLPGGITILNPVPRSLYGKQQNNEAEQLLREVIEQQQAKETEVVEENEQLRTTLYAVHVELEGLLKKHSTLDNSSTSPYGLPFEMAKDKIETEIRDLLLMFSAQWNHRPSQDPGISPSEVVVRDQMIEELQKQVRKLQLELEDSTLLVQGAQKMIDNLSSGNFLAGLQDFKLNVEGSDMTLQEMDDAEAKINKQRDDLAKERKLFTQACLDLGKQREELEQSKRDFEESKRTFRLDNVLSFLNFSPPARLEDRPVERRSPPSSPSRRYETVSKKRVATSPLNSCILDGRSVRPKTQTTAIEISDEDDNTFQHSDMTDSLFDAGDNDEQEEEEEEEEVLIRTHPRQRATVSSSTGHENMSRNHHEPAREKASAASPSVSASSAAATTASKGKSPAASPFSRSKPSTATPAAPPKPSIFSSSRTTRPSPFNFSTSSKARQTESGSSTTANRSPRRTTTGTASPRKPVTSSLASQSKTPGSGSGSPSSTPRSATPTVKRVALSSTLNLLPSSASTTTSANNGKNNGASGSQNTSSTTPLRLLDPAKVPPAFSRTAARLAAKKSFTK
ncbi:Afadin and alpha-actinin-binding-domain-containing protein [Mortierella sp. GBAus27b]|nr:hypothetical protein BGX31_006688 [Mortierella sp. GBA43]KAI8359750.1 Afadin and alpha-actinin-binding-domain-containing protein [Mortierella sp. GBAus27b]